MSRSLSLAAYMAFARRGAHVPWGEDQAARPDGELIWAHAVDTERAAALCQVAERLSKLRPGLHMLLTLAEDVARPETASATILMLDLPPDTLDAVEIFLDHWTPDLCLWTGGRLSPALLTCADEREIPLFLIDAQEDQLDRPSWRWFPDLQRTLLKRFAQVQARTEKAARALRRMGLPDADITVTGPLRCEASPLDFDEAERGELAALLLGRPVWLAAHLHPEELDTILEAQRLISRLAHRVILVIAPDVPDRFAEIKPRLEHQGLRVVIPSEGALPSEITQVVLIDPQEELGLWYRLAPICFLGGSLQPGMTGHDPNEAAVHGAAMLYGPNVRRYLQDYRRYADMRAARIVRDAETMAGAVSQLLAPDQAAAMAHAAWDVASQGAEVSDRLIDLVQDTLDVMGER